MDGQDWLSVISRWVHVGAAIVLFGGTLFQYFVLVPAAKELTGEERSALHSRIITRWRKIVMAMIGLLLITGSYNYYLAVAVPQFRESPVKGLYHGLMGTKILLSLGIFYIASALVGRAVAFEPMRLQSRKWMTITIVLATVVVGIAGFLKVAIPAIVRSQPSASAPAQ